MNAIDTIGAVGFLPPQQALPHLGSEADVQAAPTTGANNFSDWMAREFTATNTKINEAQRGVQRLAAGDTGNLHQVMLDIEQARLQFQLLVTVRNRVLEAYQDVLRMQV